MTTTSTIEFEKAFLKEGLNEVVGNQQRKEKKLVVGLWKTSQNYEVTAGH